MDKFLELLTVTCINYSGKQLNPTEALMYKQACDAHRQMTKNIEQSFRQLNKEFEDKHEQDLE